MTDAPPDSGISQEVWTGLAEEDRAAISELRDEGTELVPRIDLGHRLHTRQRLPQPAAGEPVCNGSILRA